MKSIYIAIFVFWLLPSVLFAQDNFQHKKDSLCNIIETSQGIDKLAAYAVLTTSDIFSYEQSDTLFLYFRDAIKEAQKQGRKEEEAQFELNYITYLYNFDHRKELMEIAPGFLNSLSENGNWKQYYSMYGLLLETYLNECRFETTIREAKLLYEKANKQNNKLGMGVATFNIGVAYQKLERYKDSEEYYKETIAILNQMDEEVPMLFDVYFVLCEVLSEQKLQPEALDMAKKLGRLIENREKKDNRPYPISRYSLYLIHAIIYIETDEFEKAEPFLDLAEQQLPDIERAMVNIYYHRARIAESRKDYNLALKFCDEAYRICEEMDEYAFLGDVVKIKYRVMSEMRGSRDIYDLFEKYIAVRDSVEKQKFHAQIDELRTVYEVDKHIAEKDRNRNYFLFALSGCILLFIALSIWIYYNRQIAKKNKTMAMQIKELQVQQEKLETDLLNKATFEMPENDTNDDLCPESRKSELCIAIRDIILKDKAYRDSTLTRDVLIERLGTNKNIFIEAFQFCFGMSFPEFINNLRLKDTITLLENSDLSMEEISEKVGFGSLRTFQRQFQNKYNMTPKEYRKASMK